MALFTPQELAEMAAFDAAIDAQEDGLSDEEILEAENRDRAARRAAKAKQEKTDARRAKQREYYQKNKERRRAYARQYYKDHPLTPEQRELQRARARDYYRRNKDEYNEQRRKRREAMSPEELEAWRKRKSEIALACYYRKKAKKQAAVVQREDTGFPGRERGFESRPPLHNRGCQDISGSGA